jgi:hypothetical protein
MISANNWPPKRIETILDECFCLIMCPCYCSSSVLDLEPLTHYVNSASYAGRGKQVSCRKLLLRRRHFLPRNMAADARRLTKKAFSSLLWPMSGHVLWQTRSAEAAWLRGTNPDKPGNYRFWHAFGDASRCSTQPSPRKRLLFSFVHLFLRSPRFWPCLKPPSITKSVPEPITLTNDN